MLYQFLTNCPAWFDRPAIWRDGVTATFGQLADAAREFVRRWAEWAGRPVGLAAEPGAPWVAAAAALDGLGCRTFLIPAATSAADIARLAARHGLDVVLSNGDLSDVGGQGNPIVPGRSNDGGVASLPALPFRELPPFRESPGGSTVVLFTSGTSGEPKAALHTWASLASGIKPSPQLLGMRMLLTYDPARYAGLQVLLTALLNGGQLCVPRSRSVPDAVRAILAGQAELMSATPTWWRMLLANSTAEEQARMPLRQITLGGEPVSQGILDALARAFPAARITHIYASTEMGVCYSVHDGREGFPADFLNNDALPVRLKIQDGRLWIRSKRAMAGYLAGPADSSPASFSSPAPPGEQWFDTGDAVEVREGRVFFLGRQSARINVGGEKVYPEEVEAAIRQVDGVADARVSGLDSSIAGQIVQAEIVPARGVDPAELRRRIDESCRQRLASYKRPRIIRFVESLGQTDAMKLSRRAEQ